jgi:hypothetical protein
MEYQQEFPKIIVLSPTFVSEFLNVIELPLGFRQNINVQILS